MDKGKRGEKPVKFPKPLFDSWKSIIDNFTKDNENVKLIPVVVSLQKLISSEHSAYEKQVSCIKEAVKLMQKNVASVEKLQSEQLQQIKELVEPIATLGYFAACENLSRRAFVPLIEASARCINQTETFARHYQHYLTLENSPEPSFNHKPISQKALTIYATLKFPIGQAVISQHYKETLTFLIKGLRRAQTTGSFDERTNDIQFAAKTLLVLFSRQLEVATRLFAEHNVVFREICQILLGLCVDTSYVKECNQVAGMAIGALMNLSDRPAFVRDWVLGWFFSTDSNEAVEEVEKVWGIARPDWVRHEEGWACRDAPMIFILRGLVSSLRKEIVVLDCPASIELVEAVKGYPSKNLHEIIFAGIDLFCSRPNLDASCKLIAFESMATWLQQTKGMMDHCDGKETMDAISGPIQSKNMNILIQHVLDHWDDPIDSIQHKVRTIFELSLSTLEIKTTYDGQTEEYNQFIFSLLTMLIAMDWHRKVKYSLLNMLVEKVHTDAFLKAEARLMDKCFGAMDSFVLCPQITYFVLSYLYRRVQDTIPGHQDFKGHNGKIKEKGEEDKVAIRGWMDLWVLPFLRCLTAPSELLRKNVSSFVLQPLFKISTQSFWFMIQLLQDGEDDTLWAKEGLDPKLRLNAFIAVLKAGRSLDIVDGRSYHAGPTTDHAKISIETLKLAIYHHDSQVRMDVLGLLCESRKATAEVTVTELELLKLFLPLNMNSTAPEFRQQMCAHLGKLLIRLRGHLYSQHRTYKSLLAYAERNPGPKRENALLDAKDILLTIDESKSFLFWLTDHITQSLYPGASYQRVATGLRLLSMTIKTFGVTELPLMDGFSEQPDFPFQMPIANRRLTKILVDVFMNPYDFNRVQAFDILCQFPSPLPGFETKQDVQDLLWWGLANVVSTRAGESDSGAMVFRLVFHKYVMGLGFDLSPEQNVVLKAKGDRPAAIVFTERLLDLLEKQVEVAKGNLLVAAQQHPMHGTLLALQYVFQELDYKRLEKDQEVWKAVHARVLGLIHATCDTAMPVLSDASPEGNLPTDLREGEEEEDFGDDEDEGGPKHQVILSCCWRAVKEASALLQVILTKAPTDIILSQQDLVKSGSLFQYLLTSIRHRGAFSAVYPAYVALNTRLIASRDPELAKLPAQWLQENLDSLTSSHISITRRSAGLPLCILAIVSSEPSVKKELLGRAMRYLVKLANDKPPLDADQRIDLPQVHAYNIMRTIFMDSKLGHHVLEYASEGFSLAINGFSSHSWAIRNCSVMLFSTLLQRTFGTKKTRDEHSSVNTLTGREFFVRFPDLHPYLLKELSIAVDQLLKNSLAASVHPGLYPILTLLSRMQPSTEDINETETILTPFIPLVMPCAASAIYKTREMAARALVPLVLNVVPTMKQLLQITPTMTQNEIHGRFLQIQFLLRGHFYRNTASSAFTQFIQEMPELVLALLELLESGRFCNVNSALLLNILSEFFFDNQWMTSGGKDKEVSLTLKEFSDEKFGELRAITRKYCIRSIKSDKINGIGTYLVREALANIIMIDTLNKPSPAIDSVLFLLSDHDYEVRLLTLQKLYNYFTAQSQTSSEGLEELQSILVQRTFAGEDSLNCYVLTAKLLMTLYAERPYPTYLKMPFSLEQYWDRLVVQFSEKRALSVTESVLPLMGALLSQVLKAQVSNQDWVNQCLLTWSGYIEKYSKTDITLPLREAVVKSLEYTSDQIFAQNKQDATIDQAKVSTMLAITQLLQDDDIDVREETSSIVSDALGLKSPVHHERALELVHRHLTDNFSQSGLLETQLMSCLEGENNLETLWETELSQSKALFAKENPNIFKEDLIDVQWANVDLDRMYLGRRKDSSDKIIVKIQHLTSFSKVLKTLSRTLMQNGPYGITSKPNIFIAAYGNILSLNLEMELLEKLDSIPKEFVSAIEDLSSAISQLSEDSLHPLLWSSLRGDMGLYSKTKAVLKKHGAVMDHSSMFLLSFDSRN